MNEVRKTLKRLALYYLLMAVNIIPCASIIPDAFPTRNLSSVYLMFLSVCLILYYSYRLSRPGRLSGLMKSISWLALLLILLRGIKYSVFAGILMAGACKKNRSRFILVQRRAKGQHIGYYGTHYGGRAYLPG